MSMQGWIVRSFGGPEVMQWADLPTPSPGPGQLLVRVHASGINFAETRMRAGTYSGQELPFVMGMESAGVIEAVGRDVSGFAVGDRVFGRARGSHATHVLIDALHTLPLPATLDFVQGAAIPVGWLTAWHALYTIANARAGEDQAAGLGGRIRLHRAGEPQGARSRGGDLLRSSAVELEVDHSIG